MNRVNFITHDNKLTVQIETTPCILTQFNYSHEYAGIQFVLWTRSLDGYVPTIGGVMVVPPCHQPESPEHNMIIAKQVTDLFIQKLNKHPLYKIRPAYG